MSDLLVEKNNGVLMLTMNRPESLNAFSEEMILGLTNALKLAQRDEEIRTVVISGAGRSFSAGGDVKTMGQVSGEEVFEHLGHLNECILMMKQLEKPVIAAVHGFAAGAAFNLALASDLIIAEENSQFVMSFSKVGLISDGGGLYFLPRIVGPYRAKELFFSGEPITAAKALEYGIVSRIVPLERLKDEVIAFAEKMASGPAKAIGAMKKIIDHSSCQTLEEVLEQERLTQSLMVVTKDHQEGVQAFKEKRLPQFQGR
ncbi:enoyl-CoA hydratase [Metabacillus sp. GX 13764]|uniref:enoyl-CoA hydratase/isomerase family protein n=1 Tax=Metabacillus kandeliae TaxID=2900151 RepID=UPI001E3D3B84|nr:enoyl-CoA hydratase [Metabacillus kandeliae]MCD7032700.1 enoyl-CoA hydratase [Metabacillus kandeliae]